MVCTRTWRVRVRACVARAERVTRERRYLAIHNAA
jgi:hypothetical protein